MGLLVYMHVSMYKQTLSVQKIERKALVFRIVKLIISLHTGTQVTECNYLIYIISIVSNV